MIDGRLYAGGASQLGIDPANHVAVFDGVA
jgi:hypothetical protein